MMNLKEKTLEHEEFEDHEQPTLEALKNWNSPVTKKRKGSSVCHIFQILGGCDHVNASINLGNSRHYESGIAIYIEERRTLNNTSNGTEIKHTIIRFLLIIVLFGFMSRLFK